jgi:hypothetical protein
VRGEKKRQYNNNNNNSKTCKNDAIRNTTRVQKKRTQLTGISQREENMKKSRKRVIQEERIEVLTKKLLDQEKQKKATAK